MKFICARTGNIPRHGHTWRSGKMSGRTREYSSWQSMKDRCAPNKYPAGRGVTKTYYAGRGITVCKRWHSFEAFLQDMGPRPPGTTLDRIDTDKNYTPTNCKWSTAAEQIRNRRNTKRATIRGITKTIAEWAIQYNTEYALVLQRIKRDGWEILRALQAPRRKYVRTIIRR